MVKRGSSIGFFGIFGRSEDMRRLDEALRRAGVHPDSVPEGVKLAAVTLMSREEAEPSASAYPPVGELMAFCILGSGDFAAHNGEPRLESVTRRMEAALDEGEGQDAGIILLMLHAKLIDSGLLELYDIGAENRD
ncbi:hypothetical protein [Chelativorans sp. AA-79]|uniref:hypothetical protein n=1 Tax=Chelativorans sp. AA-79 TaxID=3028735 RepID=UPI0023F6EC57|nr:hypothetical protein [Chelativorans sp. AA-79]WEX09843.1 hypothetical protein PVE73_02425 [Chelativorans sp. AA-79]